MEISLVIPAHNEADNISALLSETAGVLNGVVEYEIVFMDDGSTDDTVQELIAIKDQCLKNLRIYQHGRRSGQSAAMLTGVRAARAKWIVTLDGDGQNDPRDIPRL